MRSSLSFGSSSLALNFIKSNLRKMSKAKKAPAKKKTNGYKMPDPLPQGEILQDIYKKQWILGPSIGKGGFGEIYSAKQADSASKDYNYVIKIEPHENGPLFVEMHFYTRCAKEKDVSAFKDKKSLKHLGMPVYIASGSHTHKDEKYRFILMEKFAPKDVWKLFIECEKRLPAITVYQLALQMLDALEYIHSRGYIHGDLKGANILLSLKDANKAFLVDFGLAGKFTTDKEFVPNPKKMHNGTIEYLSRDAHYGVQSRRGDIEILAYNIIHWLTGTLPWDGKSDAKTVQPLKEDYMKNINKFSDCFDGDIPKPVEELLRHVNKIKHDEEPDYPKIKKLLLKGLQDAGGSESSPLMFKSSQKRKSTNADPSAGPKKRTKAGSKASSKQTNDTNGNEASTSTMNAEEMRIAALKSSRSAGPKKTKRKIGNDNASDDTVENDTPTNSKMNKEELRIVAMKTDKLNKTPKKATKKIDRDVSPVRSDAVSDTILSPVRRSPRRRGGPIPDYAE